MTCGGIPIVRNALDNLYTAHEAVVASAAPDVFPVPGVDHILTLMEIGVEILREITGGSDTVSDYVSSDPHLPWFLFWLITKRGYRPVIASILEEVSSSTPSPRCQGTLTLTAAAQWRFLYTPPDTAPCLPLVPGPVVLSDRV